MKNGPLGAASQWLLYFGVTQQRELFLVPGLSNTAESGHKVGEESIPFGTFATVESVPRAGGAEPRFTRVRIHDDTFFGYDARKLIVWSTSGSVVIKKNKDQKSFAGRLGGRGLVGLAAVERLPQNLTAAAYCDPRHDIHRHAGVTPWR